MRTQSISIVGFDHVLESIWGKPSKKFPPTATLKINLEGSLNGCADPEQGIFAGLLVQLGSVSDVWKYS